MKRHNCLLLLILGLLLFSCLNVYAKTYHYSDYLVNIFINQDGSFKVQESMTFDFKGHFHYAYRSIPIRKFDYLSGINVFDGETKLGFSERRIKDKFREIDIRWNFDLKDTKHTWTVEYTVHGGLGFFNSWDELYWNTIPHDRSVPISDLKVYVYLPQETTTGRMSYRPYAERASFYKGSVINGKTFYFEAKDIAPSSNFTIVAAWPKGMIDYNKAKWSRWLRPNALKSIILPLSVFILMFSLWNKKGRDIRSKMSLIPHFKPPKELTPALAGVLIDDRVDVRDITALIIDLAIKGYLKISEMKSSWWMLRKKVYKFERINKTEGLKDTESFLLEKLFKYGIGDTVTTQELDDKFYQEIPKIKEKLYENVERDIGLYEKNPESVRKKFRWLFSVIFVLFWLATYWTSSIPIWLLISIGSSFLIIGAFGMIMPRRTEYGAKVREELLGFKMYLQSTERFRLADCTPETFEKYLPYAVALRIENKWAARFKDLSDYSPAWYSGYSGGRFSSASFSRNFSGLISGIASSSAAPGGRGSGFGGGAGGGGGGGGGGAG